MLLPPLTLEHAQTAVVFAFVAYAISVGVFLILENRSPQSTFAWLLLFLSFPIGGVIFYILAGRGWRAFSQQRKLTPLIEGTKLGARALRMLEEQPLRIEALAERGEDAAAPRLARMLWNVANAPLSSAESFEVLQDAREKYPRLLADIDAARHSIHMVYYEWADDAFTRDVAARLARKAREGVKVRILYDPVGSYFMMTRRYLRELRDAGVAIWSYSPVYYLHTISYRSHRKIAVIDGRIGYSGGLNMTEKHLTGPDGFTGWRDTHARLTGEAVLALQAVFATMWLNTTDEAIVDDGYFPPDVPAKDGTLVQVVNAGPDSRWQAIRQSYLAMIAMARDHVYIQSPFLILDSSLAEVMKAVALSGVKVWVMIAPRGAEGQLAYRASMTYAEEMEQAGVRVLLYQGAYFHSKTVCVDSMVCSIGSANMDIRSFTINYETNLVIHDVHVTRKLEADFLADIAHCEEFSLDGYERSPWPTRLKDSMMRLCSPLL